MAQQRLNIDPDKIPQHVAIIMDGNGRWAKQRGLPRLAGHRQGKENLRRIVKACIEFNIQYLTLFAFSTENWGRPEEELKGLNQIFIEGFSNEIKEVVEEGVRILHIGQREGISPELLTRIDRAVEISKNNDRLILSIALNYGSRNEIMHAVRKIVSSDIDAADITETTISDALFTAGTPDPDLVVRTSGEQRLSNFLLWQAAYAEWVFPEVYWPDYSREELIKSLEEYAKRNRRFGKVSSK